MSILVLVVRLLAAMTLGLVLGYCIRCTIRRCIIGSRQDVIGQVVFLPLMLISAMTICFLPPMKHSLLPRTLYPLLAYGFGAVVGLAISSLCSIRGNPWIVGLLDALGFGTLWSMFVVIVLDNAGVPLTALDNWTWAQLVVAAGAYSLTLTIIHHCELTGKWSAYLPTFMSILLLAAYEVPSWFSVMRRGFVYMDMPSAFASGLDHLLVGLCMWPVALALALLGLIVGLVVLCRQADAGVVIASLVQLILLGPGAVIAVLFFGMIFLH